MHGIAIQTKACYLTACILGGFSLCLRLYICQPVILALGYGCSMTRQVIAQPLSHEAISGHGLQVIAAPSSPSAAHQGNQGTALVVRGMTSFPSYYSKAPSGKPASCNTAYFRCAPRPVKNGRLRIKVFERHPYTRQAFIPLGMDKYKRAYVVVVAEDKGMCFTTWFCELLD